MSIETVPTTILPESGPCPTRRQLRELRESQRKRGVGSLLVAAKTAVDAWMTPSPEYAARISTIVDGDPAVLQPGGVLYTDIGNEDYALYAQSAIGHTQQPRPSASFTDIY